MEVNQLGGFFKPGRPLPSEVREEKVDLYNAGYSMNEISRTALITRRPVSLSSARTLGPLLNYQLMTIYIYLRRRRGSKANLS